jgi:sulfur carrier protein ThiS adenylyltransferase
MATDDPDPPRLKLRVNEREVEIERPHDGVDATVGDVRERVKPDADVCILDGFPVPDDTPVAEGARISLIRRGETPSAAELQALMAARHTPGVHERVQRGLVGIAGVGGLGSAVAIALARIGVGGLVLADHDVVEPSNLNRQHYFVSQIGRPKVEAMRETLRRINPYVSVSAHIRHLRSDDFAELYAGCDVICECFDTPTAKAAAFAAARTTMSHVDWVMASGLAGYAPTNLLHTRRLRDNIVLVGDETHEAGVGNGLMAPRVMAAAGLQANAVLNLLLDADPVGDPVSAGGGAP